MFKPILSLAKVTGWAITSGAANNAHTVSAEIQPGPRFQNITISGGGGVSKKMTDLIGDIRVIANDDVVRLHSAAELNAKNVLYGPQYAAWNGNKYTNTAALNLFNLTIPFAEPWRKDTYTGDALAWNTRNLRNFRIECDIKASTFTTPTSLSFDAEADYSPLAADAPGAMGLIVKHYRTTLNLAAGWNDIMSFPRKGAYQEINFVSTDITDIQVKIGSRDAISPITVPKLRARQYMRDMYPFYPAIAAAAAAPTGAPAGGPMAGSSGIAIPGGTDHADTRGMTDLVFDGDDKPNSSLVPDPGQDFNVRVNLGSAANVVCLYSILEPL